MQETILKKVINIFFSSKKGMEDVHDLSYPTGLDFINNGVWSSNFVRANASHCAAELRRKGYNI